MKAGAGLSTLADPRVAAEEAASRALSGLGDGRPDLAVVFASTHHRDGAADVLDAVHRVAAPAGLIGCVAEAVLGGSHEVEDQPGVSVWLGAFDGQVETFDMTFLPVEAGGAFAGWRFEPDRADRSLHLLVCDPFTFPVDLLLRHLNDDVPGAVVVGGMAGGAGEPGGTILFHDRSIVTEGAVGARLTGVAEVRTIVSQGCRPFGDAHVVTRAEGNVVFELGGRPPLERLRAAVGSLGRADQELVANGIQLGRVIDEYKAEHGQGDFLIRTVVGVDPANGAMAVGDRVEVGETVRFHVRDAATADEELRSLLERSVETLGGPPAGALLFTCNGRGTRMFPTQDHDAGLAFQVLRGAPLAGFFCAGELGPVGGRNFLHGFTASLAIFAARD